MPSLAVSRYISTATLSLFLLEHANKQTRVQINRTLTKRRFPSAHTLDSSLQSTTTKIFQPRRQRQLTGFMISVAMHAIIHRMSAHHACRFNIYIHLPSFLAGKGMITLVALERNIINLQIALNQQEILRYNRQLSGTSAAIKLIR